MRGARLSRITHFMRIFLILFILMASCTKKPTEPLALDKQGQKVYSIHCTACHNANPKLDGAIGPAVHGSSKELLEMRLISGTYPAGYKPKRETKIMTLLPFIKDEIPALHAYLNTP